MNTGFCGKSFDGEKCVFCIIKRGLLLPLLLLGLLTAFSPSQKTAETTWREQYDLGVRYLSEGNYEEAIIAFTAAIEIDPKQAPAYLGRGDAYIGSGETGTLTRGEIYNPDGTMCTSTLYYYDEAGELSREEIYSSDGTLSEIGYCYYDTAGNLTQEEYFSPDGTMCSYRLAYFDEAENVVQNDWYDPDGTLRNSLKYN